MNLSKRTLSVLLVLFLLLAGCAPSTPTVPSAPPPAASSAPPAPTEEPATAEPEAPSAAAPADATDAPADTSALESETPAASPADTAEPQSSATAAPAETDTPDAGTSMAPVSTPQAANPPESTPAAASTAAPASTPAATSAPAATPAPTPAAKPSAAPSTPAPEPSAAGAVSFTDAIRPGPSVHGALHVEGRNLMDAQGEPVQLKGASTHGLAWFPDYVNQECFNDLKRWGANAVRLAMYTAEYGGYTTGGDQETLKQYIRDGVQYALNADLYVIVDWHILSDNNPNTHVDEAMAFFDEMTKEFADLDHVLYEICNEPNGSTTWPDVKKYAEQVIPVIRANDEDAVILVGTTFWCQEVEKATADPITGWDNLMYVYHFYSGTHKSNYRQRLTNALEAGLPVFVSEYGVCDASGNGGLDLEQADKWMELLDKYGVSCMLWSLCNKAETASILSSSCTKTSGFARADLSPCGVWFLDMLSNGNPPPDPPAPTPTPAPAETSAPVSSAPAASAEPASSDAPAVPSSPDSTPAAPTVTSPPVPAGGSVTWTAVLDSEWEDGGVPVRQYTVSITNTSAGKVLRWSVTLPMKGTFTLDNSWCGDFTTEADRIVITSLDWNGELSPGQTVSGIGFIVRGGEVIG